MILINILGGIIVSICMVIFLIVIFFILKFISYKSKCKYCKYRGMAWSGGAVDGSSHYVCDHPSNFVDKINWDKRTNYKTNKYPIGLCNFLGTCKKFIPEEIK